MILRLSLLCDFFKPKDCYKFVKTILIWTDVDSTALSARYKIHVFVDVHVPNTPETLRHGCFDPRTKSPTWSATRWSHGRTRCCGCFKLLQAASSCFKLLQAASSCFKLLQAASSCFKLLQAASSCFKLLQAASCFYSDPSHQIP